MHEASIAESILKVAESELAERKLSGMVDRVLVRIGRFHAVIPEMLSFHFDILKKERMPFKEAELAIEEVPLVVRCESCGRRSELEEPVFLCLACGKSVAIETGQEMFVERISIKEEE